MNELAKAYLGAIVRAALLALGTWMVKNHFDPLPDTVIPGLTDWLTGSILGVGALVWSLIHKTRTTPISTAP